MVKLNKPATLTPSILDLNDPNSKGHQATEALKRDHDEGKKSFVFDNNIYGHYEVKSTLVEKVQHKKCCFCESFVSHISHGDIEHFRPKGGYQNTPGDKLNTPGYYWLAYDFQNLFFSCEVCNRTYKRNFFPLALPTQRVTNHHIHDDLSKEEPLIIDLLNDNPADHLYFEREIPKGKDPKGKLTILRLGLDREDLNEYRLKWLKLLQEIAKYAEKGDEESLNLLLKAASPKEPFSLMVRSNFPYLNLV